MPSWELARSADSLSEATGLSVSVEAGITLGWAEFADKHVGIDRFGSSINIAMEKLGMNHETFRKLATMPSLMNCLKDMDKVHGSTT